MASVQGDESTLRQVLLNLVQNALEAVEPGGHVRVAVRERDQDVVVEIADDGVGIPEADLERVFELYYTTKDRGSGIGLSLSQRLIAQHGGRLVIESKVGAGTTVRVHLPRSRPAGVEPASTRAEEA
jgi:signal transduction histidine kinase